MTTGVETQHAALVGLIGRAHLWARRFRVLTDQTADDGDTLYVYPLHAHSEALGGICNQLGGTPPTGESRAQSSRHGLDYIEGQDLVLRLEPSSPYRTTHQDVWRAEVVLARENRVAIGASVEELDVYHRGAQALFDEAYATVREAYQACVAATYGRLWATSSTPEDGRAVFYWLKALADVGFSVEECYSVLRDIETICPAAILICHKTQDEWFLSPSDT